MKRVCEYELSIAESQYIKLPVGAEILSIQTKRGIPHLWALVDPDQAFTNAKSLLMFETGCDIPDLELKFIDTIQLNDGTFILHVFELIS